MKDSYVRWMRTIHLTQSLCPFSIFIYSNVFTYAFPLNWAQRTCTTIQPSMWYTIDFMPTKSHENGTDSSTLSLFTGDRQLTSTIGLTDCGIACCSMNVWCNARIRFDGFLIWFERVYGGLASHTVVKHHHHNHHQHHRRRQIFFGFSFCALCIVRKIQFSQQKRKCAWLVDIRLPHQKSFRTGSKINAWRVFALVQLQPFTSTKRRHFDFAIIINFACLFLSFPVGIVTVVSSPFRSHTFVLNVHRSKKSFVGLQLCS